VTDIPRSGNSWKFVANAQYVRKSTSIGAPTATIVISPYILATCLSVCCLPSENLHPHRPPNHMAGQCGRSISRMHRPPVPLAPACWTAPTTLPDSTHHARACAAATISHRDVRGLVLHDTWIRVGGPAGGWLVSRTCKVGGGGGGRHGLAQGVSRMLVRVSWGL